MGNFERSLVLFTVSGYRMGVLALDCSSSGRSPVGQSRHRVVQIECRAAQVEKLLDPWLFFRFERQQEGNKEARSERASNAAGRAACAPLNQPRSISTAAERCSKLTDSTTFSPDLILIRIPVRPRRGP